METGKGRYVGIDLGKRTYTVAIVGKRGKVTMSNGKTTVEGRQALYNKLEAADKAALETGNMSFLMAKEIEAAVGVPGIRVELPRFGGDFQADEEDGQGRRSEAGAYS
jgi:hypothetical protein